MYCQLAFSAETFEKIIKYRIVDSFRPLTFSVPYPSNQQSWLDGIKVTKIIFNRIENDRMVIINEGHNITPNSAGYNFSAGALAMQVTFQFFFAKVQDVASAGLNQPPTQMVLGLFDIALRATVGANGIPILQMELDTTPLLGLGLPDSVMATIAAAGSASFPIDIGDELGELFPPGWDRVLNAGIIKDADGNIVLRFDITDQSITSVMDRALGWKSFFSIGFKANIGNNDWCMDVDGAAIAKRLGQTVNPMLKSDKPAKFNDAIESYFEDSIFFPSPRVVLRKTGSFENVCSGLDVKFGTRIFLDFSVPSDNMLRATLGFSVNKNEWDLLKCLWVSQINPFAIFITAFDNNKVGIGFAELALSFVLPTKIVTTSFLATMLLLGFDQKIANNIIAKRLKEDPSVTKLPDDKFAFDRKQAPTTELTRDWLILKECSSQGQRFLLAGKLNVPDAVLPKLTASDLDGFSKWILIDKCVPGKGQETKGSLKLSLSPGYGANIADIEPVIVPTISLKWGQRSDGGDLIYQIINDPLGVFEDIEKLSIPQAPGFVMNNSEYRKIYVPGIPGLVEAKLLASTLRKNDFTSFATAPYPLRLRFFTNGGVREYEFKAPPALKDFKETDAEAFERISNCNHKGSSLIFKKYLELKWRVDPPPDAVFIANKWDIHVRGLEPGRKATVWNQKTGAILMQAFATQYGVIDISLLLRNKDLASSLLIGLDDGLFMHPEQLRGISLNSTSSKVELNTSSKTEVIMQQTMLTEIDHIEFDNRIENVSFDESGVNNVLKVATVGGQEFSHQISSSFSIGVTVPSSSLENFFAKKELMPNAIVIWRGNQRKFMMLSHNTEKTEVIAEYAARSTIDLATECDTMFAQVSSNGRRVRLFQKGLPIQFGTLDREKEQEDINSELFDR